MRVNRRRASSGLPISEYRSPRSNNSSDTLAMHMYNESFKKYLMGYGSAISVVLFLVALAVVGIYFRQLKKVDEIHD